MKNRILEDVYRATEEDFLFGIGLLDVPELGRIPFVQIHYRKWSCEKLEVVRDSFGAGLVLSFSQPTNSTRDLHISTRERIGIQTEQDGHTSVLCAPAWDAHLEGIYERVVRRFEIDRRHCGRFLLLIQTPDLEFISGVSVDGCVEPGPIQPRQYPIPALHEEHI